MTDSECTVSQGEPIIDLILPSTTAAEVEAAYRIGEVLKMKVILTKGKIL